MLGVSGRLSKSLLILAFTGKSITESIGSECPCLSLEVCIIMIKMSPKVWFLIQTTVHTAHSLTFGLHPLIRPHQHADTWLVRHSESAEAAHSSPTLYLLQVSHGQGSPVSALCIFPNRAPARELQPGTAQKVTAESAMLRPASEWSEEAAVWSLFNAQQRGRQLQKGESHNPLIPVL